MELTSSQKDKIKKFIPEFKKFMETNADAKNWQKDVRDRRENISKVLSKDNIDNLSSGDLKKIIKELYATSLWTNKDYKADQILKENGLDKLKEEFKNLLYGIDPLDKKFDRFRQNVKYLGPASVTEILTFVNPDKYCIWNIKPITILPSLDITNIPRYPISGTDYKKMLDTLEAIRKELESNGIKTPNFIDVDFFLTYIFIYEEQPFLEAEKVSENIVTKIILKDAIDYDFDHNDTCEKIADLGSSLGFEVEKEKEVAKGASIDVIWKIKIANLGTISYAFEVQRRGSIDSMILNLQRAKRNPTIQKLVVVGNPKSIEQTQGETEFLSEDFRRFLTYIEVKDIERAIVNIKELSSILSKLELFKREF